MKSKISNIFKIKMIKENFIKDNKGQLSLEFLLISLVAILIFIGITLPLASIGIDSSLETSNMLEIKSEILKITKSIEDVYSDGIGSRRIVYVEVPKDTNLRFSKDPFTNKGLATAEVNLNYNDNNIKTIEVPYKAETKDISLNLRKNVLTKVIVEWTEEGIVVKN